MVTLLRTISGTPATDFDLQDRPHSYLAPQVGVRDSGIAGKGLYAKAAIKRDALVMIWGGRTMNYEESIALPAHLWHYPVQVWFDTFMGPLRDEDLEPAIFINHSCAPNCGVRGSLAVVAMRDIEAGEELTYDYGMTETTPFHIPCRCGAAECRGVVDGNAWRNPSWRVKYRGYISTYIQELIRMEEAGTLSGIPAEGLPFYVK